MQSLMPIGYFPKRVAPLPKWLRTPRVAAIRSVCDCFSQGPANWIQHWTHNEIGAYSTIAAAVAVVPEAQRAEFELHFYRLLPIKWADGKESVVTLPHLAIEPMPDDFQSVGFDAVSLEIGTASFGCSPLSCNRMAEEIVTNQHCLLDDFENAKQVALQFSQGRVEPGPYYVVEVFMRSHI